MRQNEPQKSGMPVTRLLWVGLMASVATGCSSDASRFSGLFSSTDTMTTASTGVTHSAGVANPPVPQAYIDGAGGTYAAPQQPAYGARNQSMAQPYPAQQTYSPARRASSAASVQRGDLAPPPGAHASSGPLSSRRDMASAAPMAQQPMPPAGGQSAALADPSDGMTTNTIPPAGKPVAAAGNGWSTANAPRVVLRPGETIAMLSQRYGVPEKEIVKANGLSAAAAARPGQSILIPTFGARSTPTRTAAAGGALLPPGQQPMQLPQGEQKVAVLPTNPKLRQKAEADLVAANSRNAPGDGKSPVGAGGYTVQPGDSIAKIARAHGITTQALKAANGLGTEGVRVGQTLKIPAGGRDAMVEPVSTASVPAKPADGAKTLGAKPAPLAAPAAAPVAAAPSKSVNDVASADPGDKAPDATGIGKYRWPARGAVVAGFGANVGGKRNDGIDISVPTGTPVKAAENGVVIYAGNGLKELGNTVLVRHDDGTVTVYGHADSLSVQRGQKVQRGQQLATSGMSGNATQPTLHFEVRKDATPVNPMTFLE